MWTREVALAISQYEVVGKSCEFRSLFNVAYITAPTNNVENAHTMFSDQNLEATRRPGDVLKLKNLVGRMRGMRGRIITNATLETPMALLVYLVESGMLSLYSELITPTE